MPCRATGARQGPPPRRSIGPRALAQSVHARKPKRSPKAPESPDDAVGSLQYLPRGLPARAAVAKQSPLRPPCYYLSCAKPLEVPVVPLVRSGSVWAPDARPDSLQVLIARCSGLVKAPPIPRDANARPRSRASDSPCSESGRSVRPVCRPDLDYSVSPRRTIMTRSTIAKARRCRRSRSTPG